MPINAVNPESFGNKVHGFMQSVAGKLGAFKATIQTFTSKDPMAKIRGFAKESLEQPASAPPKKLQEMNVTPKAPFVEPELSNEKLLDILVNGNLGLLVRPEVKMYELLDELDAMDNVPVPSKINSEEDEDADVRKLLDELDAPEPDGLEELLNDLDAIGNVPNNPTGSEQLLGDLDDLASMLDAVNAGLKSGSEPEILDQLREMANLGPLPEPPLDKRVSDLFDSRFKENNEIR